MDKLALKEILTKLKDKGPETKVNGEEFMASFPRPFPIDYIFEIESYGYIRTMKPGKEDGPTSALWFICLTEKGAAFVNSDSFQMYLQLADKPQPSYPVHIQHNIKISRPIIIVIGIMAFLMIAFYIYFEFFK